MKNEIVRLGNLEIDLRELSQFLVKAKKNGYAGSNEKKRIPDGSKVYIFQEGDFHYTDTYWGSNQAPGFEIVRWQRPEGQGIWFMSYSGGMRSKFWGDRDLTKKVYIHLKDSLLKVSENIPFRGPKINISDEFLYGMRVNGDVSRFSGDEWITDIKTKEIVFTQDFIGGLVVPK